MHLGRAAHLNCSFHIVDMLGMGIVDRQSVLSTEQQVLLHCQIGIHDVILQHTGTQLTTALSAWLVLDSHDAASKIHAQAVDGPKSTTTKEKR